MPSNQIFMTYDKHHTSENDTSKGAPAEAWNMMSLLTEDGDANQGCMCHDLEAVKTDGCVHMGKAVRN